MAEARHVLDSGILHFVDKEVVETQSSPNLWFKKGDGFANDSIRADPWPGGVAISIYLPVRDRYAGLLPFDYEGRDYKLYFVVDHVTEIMGMPFFQVTYSLMEG